MKNLMKYETYIVRIIFAATLITVVNSQQYRKHIVQRREGDIIIGGLIAVHYHGEEEILQGAMQTIEVINMIVDQHESLVDRTLATQTNNETYLTKHVQTFLVVGINRDDNILPSVELGTMMIDTHARESHTIGQIVTEFLPLFSAANSTCFTPKKSYQKPMFAGFIGAATSHVSIETAKLLQVFSIPQISYWSTNPTLSDKTLFPYFFRTIPSDTHQLQAMVQFIEQQHWTYVSVVYEDTHYGTRAFSEIEKALKKSRICIAIGYRMSTNLDDDEYKDVLRGLKTKNARAVIVFAIEQLARKLLKAATSHPEYADHFLWISSESWTRITPLNNKTLTLYENELDGTVGFAPQTKSVERFRDFFTNLTLSRNLERNPWFATYIGEQKNCSLQEDQPKSGTRQCSANERIEPESFVEFPYAENAANALLSFVYSLNEIHKSACGGANGVCDKMNQMRGGSELARRTYEMLKNITVKGINGESFAFDKHQDGHSHYDIFNYQKNAKTSVVDEKKKWIKVGSIRGKGIEWIQSLSKKVTDEGSYCTRECKKGEAKIIIAEQDCCWKCQQCNVLEYVANGTECKKCNQGMKPNKNYTDCEPADIKYVSYNQPHSIAPLVLGIVGIICLIFVLTLYLIHKDSPIVKASGKELCFYVLLGILLTLINFWTIMSSPTLATCAISRIILSLGPTMMYAAILTKTLRVVIIFRSKLLSPKMKLLLQPESQIIITSLIVLIQVFVLVIWFLISPPLLELHYSKNSEFVFQACSNVVQPSILIGLIYPFLLILICTVLATVNRHVPTGFNETQLIGLTMYTTCVIWLAFVPIFITNEERYGLKLMIVSLCLSLSACTVLFCMFGPRCYTIIFHPEDNTSQAVMSCDGTNKPGLTIARLDVQSNDNRDEHRPSHMWRKSAVMDKSEMNKYYRTYSQLSQSELF